MPTVDTPSPHAPAERGILTAGIIPEFRIHSCGYKNQLLFQVTCVRRCWYAGVRDKFARYHSAQKVELLLFTHKFRVHNSPFNWNSVFRFMGVYLKQREIDWLIGMLLVSRSGLMEEDGVKVFHYYGFQLSSSFLISNFKTFQGK